MADQINPELAGVIQRMIDAGEPEDAIASVVQHYGSGNTESSAAAIQPGLGTALGVPAMMWGSDVVRPAVKMAGKGLKAAAGAPKLVGGAVGAAVGGSAASAAGLSPFMGTYLGGTIGSKAGRQFTKPLKTAGDFIGELATSSIPPASRRAAVYAGRAGVRGLESLLPYAGAAGAAADIGMAMYDNKDHLAENVDSSVNNKAMGPASGHGLSSYLHSLLYGADQAPSAAHGSQLPEDARDEMVRELFSRGR